MLFVVAEKKANF